MPAIHNGIGVSFRSQAFGGITPPSPDFIFTIDTTKAGISASDSIELPLKNGGTYTNLTVDWGDGSSQTLNYANRTHTYATGGIYQITISGDVLKRFRFANGGDKLKMLSVDNWGLFDTGGVNSSFYGCANMTTIPPNSPTLSGTVDAGTLYAVCTSLASDVYIDSSVITSVREMLALNPSFNSGIYITAPNVTDAVGLLNGCTSFDHPSISNLDVSSWQNFNSCLRFVNLTQSLASWDITSMTSAVNFMVSGGMSTAAYDATLVGWEATLQAAFPGGSGYTPTINIHFGSSQYTLGGAGETAKNSLVTNFGWTISDGGGI